jgi:hypothetical protein
MLDTSTFAPYQPANDAERDTLEAGWSSGKLQRHGTRLLAFVQRNREVILRSAGERRDAEALLNATKRLIIEAGVVHPSSEMRDQVQAIADEIWIRGERGEYDRTYIAHEWTSLHAANWRRWRLKEYLFVADRCAAEIVATILA